MIYDQVASSVDGKLNTLSRDRCSQNGPYQFLSVYSLRQTQPGYFRPSLLSPESFVDECRLSPSVHALLVYLRQYPITSYTSTSLPLGFFMVIPYQPSHFPSFRLVLSARFIEECIEFAKSYEEAWGSTDKGGTVSPTLTASTVSFLGSGCVATSSATSYTPDPHAVSDAEAQSYYAGLHSEPTLLYRMGKEQWSPPSAV